MFDVYLQEYRRQWRLFPDCSMVLTALRTRGLPIGILTNGNDAQQVEKARLTGLDGLVDVFCTSEQIGCAKPDRRAFETLASSLRVPLSECLFVGDNFEHDVIGARSAGMQAVLIERYGARQQLLPEVLSDYFELGGSP